MITSAEIFIKYFETFKNQNLDPQFVHQWYLIEANVVQAWTSYGHGSKDIVIAVFDNDFDIKHPDFKGKIFKAKDFDLGKTIILPSDEGNRTFTVNKPFKNLNDSAHGTSVASVAAARIGGGGIIGVAPEARIMPVRPDIYSDDTWIASFEHAINNGANVIVCSLGYNIHNGKLSTDMTSALSRLSKKAIFCFASGNEGEITEGFASHPDVIGVGACSIHNKLATYSNTAKNVEIVAPSDSDGLRVVAADISGKDGNAPDNVRYDFGGTSAACPIVGGVVALMLSQNKNLSTQQVKAILRKSGKKIDAKHIKIDAFKAVKSANKKAPVIITKPKVKEDLFGEFDQFINALDLKNFKAYEFWIRGTNHQDPKSPAFGLNTAPPKRKWKNIVATARVLDELRNRLGASILITDCYRSPEYNQVIAGSKSSPHTQFRAVDFVVRNHLSPLEWAKALKGIREEGLFKGGIGIYPSFMHLDTRGKNVDWSY